MSRTDLAPRYTETDLQNARTKGQIVGWLQGGGVAFALLMLIGLLGWVPTLLVGVGIAFVGYKLLKR